MKILFAVQDVEYHSPIGIMQISAMAKKAGHETYLGILSKENIFNKIEEINPDVIAYSGSTGEHKYYKKINKRIKRKHPKIKTIMGGPHVTFFPEGILEDSELDAICIGEGDYIFPEFLDRVNQKRNFSDLENIMTSQHERKLKLKPLIQDLDSLPFPDRELFFENTENGQAPIKNFMVSRGCPYKCSYCFNNNFKKMYRGQKYTRKHSVDYVIEEILKTKSKYPIKYVKFYDDIFTSKADDWLEEFSKKYKEKIGFPFYCLTRADLMTEDMAKLLKSAGCNTVQMAVESSNDRIRNELLQRNMGKEQMKKAFDICNREGLTIVTNYILGLPTSTIKDDLENILFNAELKIPIPEFLIFQPYPGTKLGDLCIEEGLFDGDFDKIHMSYNNRSALNCFSEEEKNIQANINRVGHIVNTLMLQGFPEIAEFIMEKMINEKTPDESLAELCAKHKWRLYSSLVYTHSKKEIEEKSLGLEIFRRTEEKI